MKFSELFPSVNDGIFTVFGSEYATEFEAIFEGIDATDLNRVALALYGNKVVLGYVTAENWEMIIKTMIALHISGWEKAYETLQEEYNAITPVSRTKTKTGTQVDDIDDSNTNLSGNKPFNEDIFKDPGQVQGRYDHLQHHRGGDCQWPRRYPGQHQQGTGTAYEKPAAADYA